MKSTCILQSKKQLIPTVYELTLICTNRLDYTPGQFVVLEIMPGVRRTYSIVDLAYTEDNQTKFKLIVKASPGRPTTMWIDSYAGEKIPLIGPSGRFAVVDSPHQKVFVATGTGIAPFVPMITSLLSTDTMTSVDLYVGIKKISDNYALSYFENLLRTCPNFNYYLCLSDEVNTEQVPDLVTQAVANTVTRYIPFQYTTWGSIDFYLCGVPEMISDMQDILTSKGANNIYTEKYL